MPPVCLSVCLSICVSVCPSHFVFALYKLKDTHIVVLLSVDLLLSAKYIREHSGYLGGRKEVAGSIEVTGGGVMGGGVMGGGGVIGDGVGNNGGGGARGDPHAFISLVFALLGYVCRRTGRNL